MPGGNECWASHSSPRHHHSFSPARRCSRIFGRAHQQHQRVSLSVPDLACCARYNCWHAFRRYFLFYFMSTILLAAGTLTAVLQMIIFSSLTGSQLRQFHHRAGMLMHLPFLFCVFGTLTLAAGIMFCMYHAFPSKSMYGVGMAMTGVVLVVFTGSVVWFCQLLWEFQDQARKEKAASGSQ
eukprot:111389-Rhodomonas_salina.1